MAGNDMLVLRHVSKTFNRGTATEKRALHPCDLTVERGDFAVSYTHLTLPTKLEVVV